MRKVIGFLAMLLMSGLLCASSLMPAQAADEVIKWKMPTAYPAGSYLWDFIAMRFADHVKALSGGRLLIEPFSGGAIGPALKVAETVKNGVAEAGHTWTGYEIGRDPTSVLYSGTPAGLSDEQYLDWFYVHGADKLMAEWRKETMGVVSFVLGLGPTEIIQSHKPIRTLEDFKGLKMRTGGIWGELIPRLGASAVTTPPSEVYTALEKKLVDCIEWADPGTNYPLGFHQIAKYVIMPGVHQTSWPWELVINAKAWEKLPADLKLIVEYAARLTTFESLMLFVDKSVLAIAEFRKSGNEIIILSDEVLQKVRMLADQWCDEQAAKNQWFEKVWGDQKAFRDKWDEGEFIRVR